MTPAQDLQPGQPRHTFLRRWGSPAGSVVSAALLSYVVWRAVQSVHDIRFQIVPLAVALPVALVSWLAQGTAWLVLSGRFNSGQLTRWSQSQALRYIPGGLWGPLARATSVPGRKYTKFATLATEQGMCLAAAVAVGGVDLAFGESAWFGLCVPAPVVLGLVLSRFRKAGHPVRARQLVLSGVIYTVGFIAYSGAIVLAQAAVGPVSDVWRVAGAGCFAWVLGVVIIFAPGGAGVREAAYVALVGRAVPSLGVAGSLVARLVLTAAEMSVLLVLVARLHLVRARDQRTRRVTARGPTDEAGSRQPAGPVADGTGGGDATSLPSPA